MPAERPEFDFVDSNVGGVEHSEIRRIPSVLGLELTLSIVESSQRPLHAFVATLDKPNRLRTSGGACELDEPPSLGHVHVDRPLRTPQLYSGRGFPVFASRRFTYAA
jgi:hypothetical protein